MELNMMMSISLAPVVNNYRIVLFIAAVLFSYCCGIRGEDVQNGYGSSYFRRNTFPEGFTSQEDVAAYFQQCPMFQERLHRFCESRQASCKGRCGTLVHLNKQVKFCSCDAQCTVNKDCCWDFALSCPHEMQRYINKYGALSQNMEISCKSYASVISGCSKTAGSTVPLTPLTSHETSKEMQPMVTSKETGLHFIDLHVYKMCNPRKLVNLEMNTTGGQHSVAGDALLWSKYITGKNNILRGDEENFIKKLFQTNIFDIVDSIPEGYSPRQCFGFIALHCLHPADNAPCNTAGHIKVKNIGTPCYSSITAISRAISMTGSNTTHFPLEATSMKIEHDNICYAKEFPDPYGIRGELIIFSFLFELDRVTDESVSISYETKYERKKWGRIECSPKVKQSCPVHVTCSNGLPTQLFACVQPTEVVFEVITDWRDVGSNSKIEIKELLASLNSKFAEMMELNPNPEAETETMHDDQRKIIRTRSLVTLYKYDMKMNDLEQKLITPLSSYFRNLSKLLVHQVVFCFVLPETTDPSFWNYGFYPSNTDYDEDLFCYRYIATTDFKAQQFYHPSLNTSFEIGRLESINSTRNVIGRPTNRSQQMLLNIPLFHICLILTYMVLHFRQP